MRWKCAMDALPPRDEVEMRLEWARDLSRRDAFGAVDYEKVAAVLGTRLMDVLMDGAKALGAPAGLRGKVNGAGSPRGAA